MRSILLWILLTVGLLLFATPSVFGDDESAGTIPVVLRPGTLGPRSVIEESAALETRHAVVGLWNNTPATITYSFRWGNRDWTKHTILPGARRWHSWDFAVPNQTTWPTPSIRFDEDGRTGNFSWVVKRLTANPTWAKGYWYGDRYAFMIDGGSRYLISLRQVSDDPAGFR